MTQDATQPQLYRKTKSTKFSFVNRIQTSLLPLQAVIYRANALRQRVNFFGKGLWHLVPMVNWISSFLESANSAKFDVITYYFEQGQLSFAALDVGNQFDTDGYVKVSIGQSPEN